MPARQVFFAADNFYHIYNRGSEKRSIFQDHRDYRKFLDRSKENGKKYAIDILCYCLMPNHFHFLLRQTTNTPITVFMNALQLGHAKYFNTKYTRVGPLFQGRFKAKLIESESYLLQLSAYIHKNPVASQLDSGNTKDSRNLIRNKLYEYRYSSYLEYLNPSGETLSKPALILSYFSQQFPQLSYQAFVENFIPDYDQLAPVVLET
jgi:putative transposase